MATTFIRSQQHVVENDEVDNYSRKYVEPVESSDKEEEVRELLLAVFVVNHVCTLNYIACFKHCNRRFVSKRYARLSWLHDVHAFICFHRSQNFSLSERLTVV